MIQIQSREQLQALITVVNSHGSLLGLKPGVKETMGDKHRTLLAQCLTLKDQASIDEANKDAIALANLEKSVRKGKGKGSGNRPQPGSMSGKIRAYMQKNELAPGKAGYDALRSEIPELVGKPDVQVAALISGARKYLSKK